MRRYVIVALTLIVLVLLFQVTRDHEPLFPAPSGTLTEILAADEEEAGNHRGAWMEAMHRAAPGVDWRAIEVRNRILRRERRLELRSNCSTASFADNTLSGFWQERGSTNQAGSILNMEYLPEKDEIWAIGDGGSLWKTSRTGLNWRVVNQDRRFSGEFLYFIGQPKGKRLLAFIDNWLHYSDDLGRDWIPADPVPSGGTFAKPVFFQRKQEQLVAFFYQPDPSAPIELLIARDDGSSVESIQEFNTTNFADLDLAVISGEETLLLAEKNASQFLRLYRWDGISKGLEFLNAGSSFLMEQTPANVVPVWKDNRLRFYTYIFDKKNITQLYYSDDLGTEWKRVGSMPVRPWANTLMISKLDPKVIYYGAIECYRSMDGGNEWEKINNWWEYYNDVPGKLHADIMRIREFFPPQGDPFTLVANHGGISISYDQLATVENIGLSDLNVSQYYSVRTSPADSALIYAGSQDQGLQFTRDSGFTKALPFEQLISGDFGHLVFTNAGQSLWSVLPGGFVVYINDVTTGQVTKTYELESENETVWLPPLMASPYPNDNAVYLAGGNKNGGKGSYLIRLEYTANKKIDVQQIDFNFMDASKGGRVSAMGSTPRDTNYWYVATTNGQFYYSHDKGVNWKPNMSLSQEGHHSYGQAIEVSAYNPKEVYLAGSGYSNPPVYRSTDGGKTFVSFSRGLPSTLVYDLDFNEKESLLFAATEAGPYVYVKETDRWYSLDHPCVPVQTYWSVEFVPGLNTVRYGTYGRGIWDFTIEAEVAVSTQELVTAPANLVRSIYPNPVVNRSTVDLVKAVSFRILNIEGALIQSGQWSAGLQQVDFSSLPSGMYLLQLRAGSQLATYKIIKQ